MNGQVLAFKGAHGVESFAFERQRLYQGERGDNEQGQRHIEESSGQLRAISAEHVR